MTNQQAINLLKGLEQSLDDYCELNDEGKAAFCMAVTALELFGNSEQLQSAHLKLSEEDRLTLKKMRTLYNGTLIASAQSERDIPKKPTATTDHTWGIRSRQAVCPRCDYYLGKVEFVCDSEGKYNGITYCEHCGQAIDWEGWENDD